MIKATKLTLAVALLAGSCSFAMAQGGGPKGSDANPPAAVKTQPGESKSAPAQGAGAPAPSGAQQVQNPTAPAAQGAETGSARDSAGPGGNRKVEGSGAAKGMNTAPTGMPTAPNSTGNMNTKGTGPGTTGTGGKGGSGNQ